MCIKVAVASSDGKVINSHFGRTRQFLIFEINDQTYTFLEIRENRPGCRSLKEPLGSMEETLELISDCKFVIAGQIGPSMISRLESMNIIGLSKPNFIEEGLKELIESYKSN